MKIAYVSKLQFFSNPAVDSIYRLKMEETKRKKKKFNEKLNEYKKVVQAAVDLIESEQKQIEQLSACTTTSDILNKRNYVHKFNGSLKKTCQEQFYKVRDSFEIVEKKNANRMKLPIPSDLVKLDDVKQKLDHLIETVDFQSKALETDESKLKQLESEIKEINSLQSAREKFKELKGQFDMHNWKNFNKNSFI